MNAPFGCGGNIWHCHVDTAGPSGKECRLPGWQALFQKITSEMNRLTNKAQLRVVTNRQCRSADSMSLSGGHRDTAMGSALHVYRRYTWRILTTILSLLALSSFVGLRRKIQSAADIRSFQRERLLTGWPTNTGIMICFASLPPLKSFHSIPCCPIMICSHWNVRRQNTHIGFHRYLTSSQINGDGHGIVGLLT